MPTPIKYKEPFICSQYYHLVFKSIDGLLLFRNENDRIYFLERFSFYTQPFLKCLAYCLLDNHVHFVIETIDKTKFLKSIENIPEDLRTVAMKKILSGNDNEDVLDEVVERQVNSFMISYVRAYNTLYQRSGSVFQSPFRRLVIENEPHLQQAIIYVHANAQKHQLINDYRSYKYSSYQEILGGFSLVVDVNAVLDFFGNKESLIMQHEQQVAYYYGRNWPNSKIEVY